MPSLRFPEFTGEWEKHKLGDLGTTLIGLTYSPSDVVKEGGTIVLRSSNIQNGCIDYTDIVRVGKHIKEQIITRSDDILICARNGSARLIGKNALLTERNTKQTFGAFMMIYRSPFNKFVKQLLNTRRYMSQIGENLGARINQVTTSDFNSFSFYFPSSIEQKKIADFLSLLDSRIATQRKIIEKLESLIRGISMKVFGIDKPNTRLCDILVCQSTTLRESQLSKTGLFPAYGATGVCGYTEKPMLTQDSILIVKDGSGVGTVRYVSGEYSVIGTLNYLVPKDVVNLKYLYFVLKSFNFEQYRTGMAIPHIYFRDYGKAKIYLPSLEKQNNIEIMLSSLERKAEIETELLSAYILQKEFLLTTMFI